MKPLAGIRIMTTRPDHQSGGLRACLEALGATVFMVPVVQISPPEDLTALHDALENLSRYDWVVFTSVNGVNAVRSEMESLGVPLAELTKRKLAAIGPATAQLLTDSFREPDLVPQEYVSESIAKDLGDVQGLRFLLARADLASKDLPHRLKNGGAEVQEVVAYRITRTEEPELPKELPDVITLTSSEIARGTYDLMKRSGKLEGMKSAHLACIGPITAATVRALGLEPGPLPAKFDIPGLVDSLIDRFGREVTHA